jgi:2-polyprenyl-3-methyl-5-hydroxy-6-metoxy-1,4-benzoquinol methylase
MNQEYITDVAYTSGYYGQLAPVWLNYIAAINGYAPRQLTEGFTYCELGCGNGLTTNVLAAANPDGRFWGADLNPEHITNAREVAQAGKLSNVTFLEKTFSDLLQEGLPDFDFVTLHGVWSWVSDEVRGQIKAFLRAKLKPGGIVLISYNTLPGWSAVLPMREMMLEYTRYLPGNSLDKVRQGLTYLRHLCDNGSHYFAHNPTAVRALEDMERSDPRYLAHEYFHANWEPCYFNRLNSEIRETGLTYAGALPLIENYQDLSVPAKLQPLLQTAPSRLLWETHKDFARNTRFRTDLYVNSELPPQNPQSAWFEDMAFGLPIPEQELINEVAVPAGSINVNGELYPALARILLDGPCTLETIRAQLAQAGHGEEDALLALQRTMLLGQCIPCRRPALPLGDAPPSPRLAFQRRHARTHSVQGQARHVAGFAGRRTGATLQPF